MKRHSMGLKATAAAALLASAMGADALPNLQLTILDGNYVGSTDETTYASGNPFTLYALMQPSTSNGINDTYNISAAIVPKTGPGAVNYGSFEFNGSTVVVSNDMVYGVPPLETTLSGDPGDLATHGIFETFFKEFSFQFDPNQTTTAFDAQTTTPSGSGLTDTNCDPTNNQCMYFKAFTVDVANLTQGSVHFDLYNTLLCAGAKDPNGQCASSTDIDVNQFAPFSHDAQSASSTSSGLASSSGQIPEPSSDSLALIGLGLVASGFGLRRKASQS